MRKCWLCHVNVPARCSHYCKPVKPIKAKTMTDLMREQTQQIGKLNEQVNARDEFIAAAEEDYRIELNKRDATIARLTELLRVTRDYIRAKRQHISFNQWVAMTRHVDTLGDIET